LANPTILPPGRVHLLAGISSSGKSRFAVPALIMGAAGLAGLTLMRKQTPWCIVSRDRQLEDVQGMVTKMGFDLDSVHIIPAFGKHAKPRYQIFEIIHKHDFQFVLWEGIDLEVNNPNNPHDVSELLSSVTAHCQDGLTVLGTVGVAKLKPAETYQNPRQLVAGSSIWERCTHTNMVIMPINPLDIEDGRRLLYVSLKDDPSFAVAGEFGERGILAFEGYDQRERGARLANAPAKERTKVWYNIL